MVITNFKIDICDYHRKSGRTGSERQAGSYSHRPQDVCGIHRAAHNHGAAGIEERIAHVLSMDKEAKECLFAWWNGKVERINRIEDDAEVDSREMKHPAHVARLALIIQVLRYAADESHRQFVDMISVKAAIRLNDYFEDSYVRIRSFVANDTCEDPPKVLMSLLPDTFDTKTAIAIGKELQGVSERTVMNYLKELCRSRLLRKAKAGLYEKIIYESDKSSTTENESSTKDCNE